MMKKSTIFGFFLLASSFLMYLLQLVARLMKKDLNIFSIKEIFGIDWIQSIPWSEAKQMITILSDLSLSSLFMATGIIFFVMGAFQKGK